ncbi:MAG: hypothetical protein IKE43_07930 [Coriobacteriales bacterium]|nr:hypothetical protein [Coriobacteriales bacterium]
MDRGEKHAAACRLIDTLEDYDIPIFTAITTLKDVYYLIGSDLKRMTRLSGEDITPQIAAAINETAWGCIRNLISIAPLMINMGSSEVWRAISLKQEDPDFEDALTITAAEKATVSCIVTGDKTLSQRSHIACFDTDTAVSILRKNSIS